MFEKESFCHLLESDLKYELETILQFYMTQLGAKGADLGCANRL